MARGPQGRGLRWRIASWAAVLLVAGGVALFSGPIIRVIWPGVGTIVLEINEPGAEVLVDGKKIITSGKWVASGKDMPWLNRCGG